MRWQTFSASQPVSTLKGRAGVQHRIRKMILQTRCFLSHRFPIDATLALLTFLHHRKEADLLLLSAMVANGAEIARWLRGVTGREVEAFDDPWKPTRQLRSPSRLIRSSHASHYVGISRLGHPQKWTL
jgi:hypothetical protein